jgi:hypothetical protein
VENTHVTGKFFNQTCQVFKIKTLLTQKKAAQGGLPDQRVAMYIVISKPKRISVKLGVTHCIEPPLT